SASVDGIEPKSYGKALPRGNTLLSQYRPSFSSYLYLLRLPFGVSTTTRTSPESGSRALRCSSSCAVRIHSLPFSLESPPTCKTDSLYCASASHIGSESKNDADLCGRPGKVRFVGGKNMTLDIPRGRAVGVTSRNLAAPGRRVILRMSQNE